MAGDGAAAAALAVERAYAREWAEWAQQQQQATPPAPAPDTTNPKDRVGEKKVPLGLVPPAATIYCALAFRDGARKYGPYNWRAKKVRMTVYINAMLRHIAELLDGEWLTADTRVPHLGAIMACAAILADAHETGNLLDDRPAKGAASRLLEEWREPAA